MEHDGRALPARDEPASRCDARSAGCAVVATPEKRSCSKHRLERSSFARVRAAFPADVRARGRRGLWRVDAGKRSCRDQARTRDDHVAFAADEGERDRERQYEHVCDSERSRGKDCPSREEFYGEMGRCSNGKLKPDGTKYR